MKVVRHYLMAHENKEGVGRLTSNGYQHKLECKYFSIQVTLRINMVLFL
jgi:hypothetical protein